MRATFLCVLCPHTPTHPHIPHPAPPLAQINFATYQFEYIANNLTIVDSGLSTLANRSAGERSRVGVVGPGVGSLAHGTLSALAHQSASEG